MPLRIPGRVDPRIVTSAQLPLHFIEPSSIPDLLVWLEVAKETGYVDNDNVDHLTDWSGNGWDPWKGGVGNYATYHANSGFPYITVGEDSPLSPQTWDGFFEPLNSGPFTVVCTGIYEYQKTTYDVGAVADCYQTWGLSQKSLGTWCYDPWFSEGDIVSDTTVYTSIMTVEPDEQFIWFDDTLVHQDTRTASQINISVGTYHIGGNFLNGNTSPTIRIYGFCIYTRVLSEQERMALVDYFAQRIGA